ncbi:MAG: DUF6886 family protein [Phenylobacterium sp.]
MKPRLFHVSEDAGIARFEPRPPPSPDAGVVGDAVWAVAQSHLVNFLTPRDCPRIAFRAGPAASEADRARFLAGAERVVAFEAAWLERVRGCALYLYDMPPETFEEALPEAGYWISREAVTPTGVLKRSDLMAALAEAGAEVRILDDFWPLADAVAASTLQFSILRKRNAGPRRLGA